MRGQIFLLFIFFATLLHAADEPAFRVRVAPGFSKSKIYKQIKSDFLRAAQDEQLRSTALKALNAFGQNRSQAFALIDTSAFFSAPLMNELYAHLPSHGRLSLGVLFSKNSRELNAQGREGEPVDYTVPKKLAELFSIYTRWLTELLNESLPPTEQVVVDDVSLRTRSETIYAENDTMEFHVDGGYLAASVALHGPGTEYLPNAGRVQLSKLGDGLRLKAMFREEFERMERAQAANCQTILYSSEERRSRFNQVASLLHRMPNTSEDRILLVIRWKLAKKASQ